MTSCEDKERVLLERIALREYRAIENAVADQSIGSYSKLYETWRRARNIVRFFKDAIGGAGDQIKVADIGCGCGLYVFLLNAVLGRRKTADFYGIDIVPENIEYAERLRKQLKVNNAVFAVDNAEALTLPENSFDIVVCVEVVEHLVNPAKFITQLYKILKHGGVAIIATPNLGNPIASLKRLLRFGSPVVDIPPVSGCKSGMAHDHISVKSRCEWVRLMKESGFRIESMRRGALFFGGAKYDSHPACFGISVLLDAVLDYLPFMVGFTENITFKLRKP